LVFIYGHKLRTASRDSRAQPKPQPSQKIPKDTTKLTWKTGGLLSLTFNQAASATGPAGGDKSALSLKFPRSNLYAFYQDGRRSWDNFLNLQYGVATRPASVPGRQ